MFTSKGKGKTKEAGANWRADKGDGRALWKRRKASIRLERVCFRTCNTEWRVVWGPHRKLSNKPVPLPFTSFQTVLPRSCLWGALHSRLKSKCTVKEQFLYGSETYQDSLFLYSLIIGLAWRKCCASIRISFFLKNFSVSRGFAVICQGGHFLNFLERGLSYTCSGLWSPAWKLPIKSFHSIIYKSPCSAILNFKNQLPT